MKVLFNNFNVSGNTINSISNLVNGYYVYTDSIGGGIVNQNNVMNFLDDTNNFVIASSFLDYLTGSTNPVQLKNILKNLDLLAQNFNNFYNLTYNKNNSNPYSGNSANSITQNVIYYNNNFKNNTRIGQLITEIDRFSTEPSFYIELNLNHGNKNLFLPTITNFCPDINSEDSFSFTETIQKFNISTSSTLGNKIINFNTYIQKNTYNKNITLLQSFVDENFNDNESEMFFINNSSNKLISINTANINNSEVFNSSNFSSNTVVYKIYDDDVKLYNYIKNFISADIFPTDISAQLDNGKTSTVIEIPIILNTPSEYGNEQVKISLVTNNPNVSIGNNNVISFNKGEQTKSFSLTLFKTFFPPLDKYGDFTNNTYNLVPKKGNVGFFTNIPTGGTDTVVFRPLNDNTYSSVQLQITSNNNINIGNINNIIINSSHIFKIPV